MAVTTGRSIACEMLGTSLTHFQDNERTTSDFLFRSLRESLSDAIVNAID